MTRFACVAIAGCMLSALLSTPAYAGPILVPDPMIGIRGIDDSPPPPSVLDAAPQALSSCSSDFGQGDLAGFFCAMYRFSFDASVVLESDSIFSATMSFWDAGGNPVPNQVCPDLCSDNYFPASQSDFHGIVSTFEDGFSVQLFADDESFINRPEGTSGFIDILLFSDLEGFVSLRQVNDQENSNTGLYPVEKPLDPDKVPEPGTLLLIGTGLVGLAGRRRLHRRAAAKG